MILCAGTVQTPQLLMLSGIGPAAHLKAVGVEPRVDLPGVGQNLQDHLFAPFGFAVEYVLADVACGCARMCVDSVAALPWDFASATSGWAPFGRTLCMAPDR